MARVELEFVGPNGKAVCLSGMTEDRSETGVGIRVKSPINAGTVIAMKYAGRVSKGVVRHCVQDTTSYFVGVALEPNPDEES